MGNLSVWLLPVLLAVTGISGAGKQVNVYQALVRGAEEGLHIVLQILPSLLALLPAISMLRASGAPELFTELCAPLWNTLGIPAETVPLMLIRPLSGSGAMATAGELIRQYGADSVIGRTAAVMTGSTETTFYIIAVYFGAAGVQKTRHAIPAALIADFTGFLTAALTVKWFFP